MGKANSLQFSSSRFQVWLTQTEMPNGQLVEKSIIRHPGAVVILPLIDNQTVCLIENFRPAVGKVLLELPAGTREPEERAIETARRELTEETGYRAENIEPLTSFYAAPGILDERMDVFLATRLSEGEPDLQPDESIVNRVVSLDEAMELIRNGEIEDSKTMNALLYYATFGRD